MKKRVTNNVIAFRRRQVSPGILEGDAGLAIADVPVERSEPPRDATPRRALDARSRLGKRLGRRGGKSASRAPTGAGGTVLGRIERGEREILDDVVCVRAGTDSDDLVDVAGRLVITSFEGKVEDVSFTPDDDDIEDAEIFPITIRRDESAIHLTSERSRWVFAVVR